MANRAKGVSAPKRKTRQEREEALAEAARLRRRGHTQAEIGAALGVTPQQVSYDLAVVRKRHLDSMLSDRREMVAESLDRIRGVMRAAWEAFDRSKLDAVRVTTSAGVETTTRQTQAGDPAFLRLVLDCERQVRELFGLDEAARMDLSGRVVTVDWAALVARRPDVDRVERAIEAALAGKKVGPDLLEAGGTA